MSKKLDHEYELAQKLLKDWIQEMRMDDVARLTGLRGYAAQKLLDLVEQATCDLRWSR